MVTSPIFAACHTLISMTTDHTHHLWFPLFRWFLRHCKCRFEEWDKFNPTRPSNISWLKLLTDPGSIYTRTLLRKTSEVTVYLWKSYCSGCSFTLIPRKCAMKMTTFESSNKSVYFENGTTSHLSFSSCKLQNGSKPAPKPCTSKMAPHRTCRFPRVNSKNSSKPARSVIGMWFFTCLDYARIHLIRF